MSSMSGPDTGNSPETRQTRPGDVPALTTLLMIDEVVVPRDLYDAARAGSDAAIEELAFKLSGTTLYRHAFPLGAGEKVVKLQDLDALGVIDSVILGIIKE